MAGNGTKRARAYATDVRSWWKLTYERSGGIRVLTRCGSEVCIAAVDRIARPRAIEPFPSLA
jgi:hypothetical protein